MKKKILIVEDDPMVIKMIELVLIDYVLLVATDGLSGVNKMVEEKPDMVFMDLSLPVLNGYEAIRKIKKIPEIRDIPVYALSARKIPYKELLDKGFDGYQEKPFVPDLLIEKIEEFIGK